MKKILIILFVLLLAAALAAPAFFLSVFDPRGEPVCERIGFVPPIVVPYMKWTTVGEAPPMVREEEQEGIDFLVRREKESSAWYFVLVIEGDADYEMWSLVHAEKPRTYYMVTADRGFKAYKISFPKEVTLGQLAFNRCP